MADGAFSAKLRRMRLAGDLRTTTLGDLLGALYRGKMTGVVELRPSPGRTGKVHRVYLSRGLVLAVDTDAKVPPLGALLRERGLMDAVSHGSLVRSLAHGDRRLSGEILVDEQLISPELVSALVRQQVRLRVDWLFRLADAQVSFHVACPLPRGVAGPPLSPGEYLWGRPRARDRAAQSVAEARRGTDPTDTPRARALRVLGLGPEPSDTEIRGAFRKWAALFHPDRYPAATHEESRKRLERFAELSGAYHYLLDSPSS